MSAEDASRDIDVGGYKDRTDWERIAINGRSIYRELGRDGGPQLRVAAKSPQRP